MGPLTTGNLIRKIKFLLSVALVFGNINSLHANWDGQLTQSLDSTKRMWVMNFEIRPRLEYRYNYFLSASDTVSTDLYLTQRNRLNVNYETRRLKLIGSIQEIHTWSQSTGISGVGSLNAFELYLEPVLTDKLSLRIGRQGVSLDNGRIFSDAPWAQHGRSHEGLKVMYTTKTSSSNIFVLFTRPYADYFDKTYSPVASHKYKYMLVYQLKAKAGDRLSINTINYVEFREQSNTAASYQRYTAGTRLEWENERWYFTVNGFYQFGKNELLKQVNAYYVQSEVRIKHPKTILRLGAEMLSGSTTNGLEETSRNFDISYGVAWKFMGNMNFFTRFPSDVGGKGLIDPYLFLLHQVTPRFSTRLDLHLFFNQYPLAGQNSNITGRYLGIENDISIRYTLFRQIEINYGFSYALTQEEMELLGKINDAKKIAIWSYLMISYNFSVLKRTKHY